MKMKQILLHQQLGARRIPHYLTVPVAHKTGDGTDVANDAGIVYSYRAALVISFLAMGITGPYAETEDQIGQILGRLSIILTASLRIAVTSCRDVTQPRACISRNVVWPSDSSAHITRSAAISSMPSHRS